MYDEGVFLEGRLFPWLASDCMADETADCDGVDYLHPTDDEGEDGAFLFRCECGEPICCSSVVECPECGAAFQGGE